MRRSACGGALLTALGVLGAGPARAEVGRGEGGVYVVDAACPGRDAWLAALRARLPPLLRTHPAIETLSVHIEKVHGDSSGYVGELGPLGADPSTARSVHGASCQEVVDALSFIGALGLERAARLRSGSVDTSGAALAVSAAEADPQLDAVPPAAEDAVERPRLGAAGFALFHGGLIPADALAFGAGARLSWRMPGLQPWVLLGAYFSPPEQVALGDGRLRFEHWSTHAVACPWRFPASGALGLRPCLELDVGRTTGEAFGVRGATRRSAPWLAAGAGVRAELAPWQRLEVGLALAGVAPLWHSHFYLRPDLTGFDTPRVGYRAEAYTCVLF